MDVNWIAILASSVFAMFLGFIWYSPALFEKQWLKLSGLSKEKIKMKKDQMPLVFGGQFVTAIVEIWVLSIFIGFTGATEFVTGAMVGLWIWLGFVATLGVGDMIFNKKPLQLVAINTGYQLVLLMVSGGIVAVWR